MTRWLRDLPIRRKLMLVVTGASALALLTASGMLLAWDVDRFRADGRDDLQTLATIIADNSTAALSFDDPATAAEMLAALAAKPQVTAAAIYGKDGRIFAAYRPADGVGTAEPGRGARRLPGDRWRGRAGAADSARPGAHRHALRAQQPGGRVRAAAGARDPRTAGAAGGMAAHVSRVVVAAASDQ